MFVARIAVAAATLAVTTPAWCVETVMVQNFSVSYAPHGSRGKASIASYVGPLQLNKVVVDWTGSIGMSANAHTLYPDDQPYMQGFTGVVGFYGYSDVGSGAQPIGMQDVTSAAECTRALCSGSLSGSGTIEADPLFFLGRRQIYFDSLAQISPHLNAIDTSFYANVGGTITYYLSDAPASAIPETQTWVLTLAGFGLVGGALRMRQKALRFRLNPHIMLSRVAGHSSRTRTLRIACELT